MRAARHTMKPQDAVWLQGRQTKVARLAKEWSTHKIDTDATLEQLLAGGIATLPVLNTLWEART
jgi:hypothetical protein